MSDWETEAQARVAQQTADACRAVWNTGLEQRREYRRRGAWMNYSEQGTRKVRWRSARRWVSSFRFPQGSQMELRKLNRGKTAVKLPKLGWVKFRASRSLEGETLRSATLSKEGAHWFVSLLVEDGVSTPAGRGAADTAVGVDRGVVVAKPVRGKAASATGMSRPTSLELPGSITRCFGDQGARRAK